MHYSDKLKQEIESLKAEKREARAIIGELFAYLESDKFAIDNSVNRMDIVNRLSPVLTILID